MNTSIVHYSQTRRKACKDCVKGKRRCDLILPRCGRCVKRDVECVYIDGLRDQDTQALHQPLPSKRRDNVPFTAEGVPATSQLPVNNTDYDVSRTISSFHVPSRVTLPALHIKYLSTYLRTSIASLALQNRTFFIHPSFLADSIPPPLLSAISVSALSTLQSPATFTSLDAHLDTLIASSPLMIFQIIRLFSLEEQQIFHAEKDFDLLNQWTIALQTSYFSLPLSSTTYSDWVLRESIRRTIHTSVLLRSLYCLLKCGYTELVPLIASLPVSSTGMPWEEGPGEGVWEGSPKEEVGTYFEYLSGGVLLCLEEDGRVGEAAWELIDRVKSGKL
ncbi:hypothetical protein B0J14DRAFT_604485 [Halenospora varia]|nr:hypothetical protein B0J14DRAFT_604485 [Halenospora varia]